MSDTWLFQWRRKYNEHMKKQVFNPYLPSYEYIPDGEPHVFDGRLYVFGSHDRFGAPFFCENDYVLWSAPVFNLSDWKFHGTIFKKEQDPLNQEKNPLFAPDVTKGKDGRFYLYYCPCNTRSIGVAVADRPEGPYEFLAHVRYEDGALVGQREKDPYPFDPAVLIDDGKIYLYIGFSPDPNWDFMEKEFGRMPLSSGAYVLELNEDMHTVKRGAEKIVIEDCPDQGHDFFEASSIRKVKGLYFFIYSSMNSHELCYATGQSPIGPFTYRGILHDNGDIGIVKEEDRVSYTGNNHGSLVEVNGDYYIFGHRQTNYSAYARQGVAEKIEIGKDGFIKQAEMSSCGLNGGPLKSHGEYGAYIACHLTSKNGAFHYYDCCDDAFIKENPAFTQDGEDREEGPNQYIGNMKDGSTAGFKYFSYRDPVMLSIRYRGAKGVMEVRASFKGKLLGTISLSACKDFEESEAITVSLPESEHFSLYFTYRGEGAVDFESFRLQ